MKAENDAKKPRILCVDDSDDFCVLITGLLRDYDVQCARGVREGLIRFRSDEFELVVLDYQLLDGEGTEFSRAVRDEGSDVPIIMITVSYQLTDAAAAAAGIQKVLRKLKRGFAAELKNSVDQFIKSKAA
ncbi:MAG TPA: response regulator [Pyrinomonadaceae bacterium]|jgi:CheY-like chemotaxis protein|nr:response regulator [Pyrinomonadaceae bacterium]